MSKNSLIISLIFLLAACQKAEGATINKMVTQQRTVIFAETEARFAPTGSISLQENVITSQVATSPPPTKVIATQEPLPSNDRECLPSLETFAFNPAIEGVPEPVPTKKLPSGNWNDIVTVPHFPYPEFPEGNSVVLEVLQSIEGSDRVWIIVEDTEKYHFSYYQTDDNRWVNIEPSPAYSDGEGLLFFPKLFLDMHNSIWLTLNPSNYYKTIDANTALLSIYDEVSQQFDPKLIVKDLPSFDSSQSINNVRITNPQMDGQGDIWFFLTVQKSNQDWEYLLYKFSPINRTLTRHLSERNFGTDSSSSFTLAPDGSLYALDTKKYKLIHYYPVERIVEEIKISRGEEYLSSLSSLFLDNRSRLWINDKAFLDLHNDDWYIIVKPPDFISYEFGRWTRTQPTYSLQTKDGRIWYSANYRGSGWVDPNSGVWCLFTSYPSNIVKDSKGHLWMIADGKLYRNSLQQ